MITGPLLDDDESLRYSKGSTSLASTVCGDGNWDGGGDVGGDGVGDEESPSECAVTAEAGLLGDRHGDNARRKASLSSSLSDP